MRLIHSVMAGAILIVGASACVQGAPKAKDDSPAFEAKAMFEQIDALSSRVSEAGFNLNRSLEDRPSHELQAGTLDRMGADVNAMNKDVRTLEAERAFLSEWENKTLDEILPFIHEIGGKAENAIETFNSNESRLMATSFRDDTASISKDASQVVTVVHEHLKLSKVQETEARIEQSLGEATH